VTLQPPITVEPDMKSLRGDASHEAFVRRKTNLSE
jgi:hypothetical protein